MRTDSACMARHRSSARPVTLLYFTPASGLNSNVVTTGRVDLGDLALDGELAALFFELSRGFHELPLVDLALGLGRIEERRRRQRERALTSRTPLWARVRQRLRRQPACAPHRTPERGQDAAASSGSGAAPRADPRVRAGLPRSSDAAFGPDRPPGRFLDVLGDDIPALALFAAPLDPEPRPSHAARDRSRDSGLAARTGGRRRTGSTRITDNVISVSSTMIEPVRFRYSDSARLEPRPDRSAGLEGLVRPRRPRRRAGSETRWRTQNSVTPNSLV